VGHEEAFPPPRLSGRCGIRKRSFAGDCPGHLGFWVRLISLALLFEATARSTPRGFVISMIAPVQAFGRAGDIPLTRSAARVFGGPARFLSVRRR